jgi:hypothetical protein
LSCKTNPLFYNIHEQAVVTDHFNYYNVQSGQGLIPFTFSRSLTMFSLADYIPKEKIAEYCRKNHIVKLALFGSALRDELKSDSDIDILVEFEKGHVPGLITFAGMEIELTDMIGRKVDLRTAGDLSRYFRDDVVNSAEVQYAVG